MDRPRRGATAADIGLKHRDLQLRGGAQTGGPKAAATDDGNIG
jgi:hypothetical protein